MRTVDRSLADAFPELERDVIYAAALERIEPAVALTVSMFSCRGAQTDAACGQGVHLGQKLAHRPTARSMRQLLGVDTLAARGIRSSLPLHENIDTVEPTAGFVPHLRRLQFEVELLRERTRPGARGPSVAVHRH